MEYLHPPPKGLSVREEEREREEVTHREREREEVRFFECLLEVCFWSVASSYSAAST